MVRHSPDKFYSPVLYTIGGYALTYSIPPYSILRADDEVRNAQYSGREEKVMENNPSLEDNCKKNNRIRINLRINIYLSWPFNR